MKAAICFLLSLVLSLPTSVLAAGAQTVDRVVPATDLIGQPESPTNRVPMSAQRAAPPVCAAELLIRVSGFERLDVPDVVKFGHDTAVGHGVVSIDPSVVRVRLPGRGDTIYTLPRKGSPLVGWATAIDDVALGMRMPDSQDLVRVPRVGIQTLERATRQARPRDRSGNAAVVVLGAAGAFVGGAFLGATILPFPGFSGPGSAVLPYAIGASVATGLLISHALNGNSWTRLSPAELSLQLCNAGLSR